MQIKFLLILYINALYFQNYFLIFKFNNGINIHYFDEALSRKLGYSQKDLLNFSIEKIMPKELRIPHTSAIIKNIINDKNIYINAARIFLFDREMKMYPSVFSGICLPGVGKYLYYIAKIIIKMEKIIYYFYLEKNLECISLSNNFYKNYHISLNLLNKYKISLLDLIDFKFEELELLNRDIIKINKYKENLDMITDIFMPKNYLRKNQTIILAKITFILLHL